MQRNRGKQQNGKEKRSLQENQRYEGNISCKDGHNKDRNHMNLTEAEDIKKRWQGKRIRENRKNQQKKKKEIIKIQAEINEN